MTDGGVCEKCQEKKGPNPNEFAAFENTVEPWGGGGAEAAGSHAGTPPVKWVGRRRKLATAQFCWCERRSRDVHRSQTETTLAGIASIIVAHLMHDNNNDIGNQGKCVIVHYCSCSVINK
eukprot:1181749-Prorocentrum_minimum.AAC.3